MGKRKKFVPHKWRHRYNYICEGCGKKRTTLNHERMQRDLCTVCQSKEVNENQNTLFSTVDPTVDERV